MLNDLEADNLRRIADDPAKQRQLSREIGWMLIRVFVLGLITGIAVTAIILGLILVF